MSLSVIIALGDGAMALGVVALVLALHGTVLVAITAAVARALALAGARRGWRQQPALLAALWTVAIIKFVLPVGPALPWSMSDLLAALPRALAADAPIAVPAVAGDVPVEVAALAPSAPAIAPGAIALALMALLGVALWVVVAARRLLRLTRQHRAALRVARALPPAGPATEVAVAALAARLGVRPPRVHVAATGSPYVIGVWRPIVVVPRPLLTGPAALCQAALAHELAHVARRDGVAQLMVAVIEALLWWCPVIPWARRRLEQQREAACDAAAVSVTDVDVASYARLLVRQARVVAAGPIAAHLGAGPRLLDARIRGLVAGVGAPRLGRLGALALVPWTALALGGARPASAAAPGPTEICVYTPEMAESLLAAFPEADGDGDGELSRVEACDLQAELRRQELMASAGLDEAGGALGPVALALADTARDDDTEGVASDELDAEVSLADDAPGAAPASRVVDLRAARELLEETTSCCKCSADEGNSTAASTLRSAGSPACSSSRFDNR